MFLSTGALQSQSQKVDISAAPREAKMQPLYKAAQQRSRKNAACLVHLMCQAHDPSAPGLHLQTENEISLP